MLKPDVQQWVGRTETLHDSVSPGMLDRLDATLNTDRRPPHGIGATLPPLSHWCAFAPTAPMGQLALDGHARLGGFLPPVQLDRRMWAGGELEFHAPLHAGRTITRVSTILSVAEKEGAAGPMTFVSVQHDLMDGPLTCVTERQDIVYLDVPDAFAPPRKTPVPDTPDLTLREDVSAARLFRFSAVTFNAHRIHYDLDYARTVEKYPGLVVHGPLQAMLLMRAACRATGRRPRRFTFRGVHPMFHFDDMHIFGSHMDDGTGMTLCTGVPGGHQGMQAQLIWDTEDAA